MKRKIWIFNHYAEPPQYEPRIRNNAMAKYLMREGYNVTIFAASTIHNTDINLITDGSPYIRREYDGLKFMHINVPKYSGNGLSRKINLLLFPYRLWKYTKRLEEKPDVIVNDLSVMAMNFPFKIAKRYNVPIVTEVRDLWPESIIEYGLLKRESLLAKFLYAVERQIYRKSDAVVFAVEGAYDYIIKQGWEKEIPRSKVFYINNGVDLESFQYNRDHHQVDDPDLDNPDICKIVYTGSIRLGNNMGALLDLAKQVTDPRIKFLLWGAGDQVSALQQRVKDEQIDNVIFKGHVEKKYIPSIVSQADYNFLDIVENADALRYGNSQNKLFDYFAAGKPLLMRKQKYNPAERFSCGLFFTTEEELLKIFNTISTLPKEEYEEKCLNAKAAAEEYDFKKLTKKLLAVIEGCEP